jgi:diacylglycerol kinase family enzyme
MIRIIVNPAAAGGRALARWNAFEPALRAHGLSYECVLTDRPGHATRLAREAAAAGIARVAACGGDGTLHEVVQGLVRDDATPSCPTTLVFLPAGSSCDFDKELPPGRSWLARLESSTLVRRDLIRIEWRDSVGRPLVCYAVNGSHIGLVAEAAHRINRGSTRAWSSDLAALVAALATFGSFSAPDFELCYPGEPPVRPRLLNVAVLKTAWLTGGMHLGVPVSGCDARIATIEARPVGTLGLIRLLAALYRRTFLNQPGVLWRTCDAFRVAQPAGRLVEADGEIAGRSPAAFSVVPGLLSVAV